MSEFYKISQMQNKLDVSIKEKFDLTCQTTRTRRILATQVELAELANETRCFKYWSTKGPAKRSTILEEYADGIHFLVSLGISYGFDFQSKDLFDIAKKSEVDLTDQFLDMFQQVAKLKDDTTTMMWEKTFLMYITIGYSLGFSKEDIVDYYIKKNEKNHDRQANNY